MLSYFSLNNKKFCFDLLIHLYLVPMYFLKHYINTPSLARVEEGWIGRVCLIKLMFLSEVWSLYHISSTELLTPCLSAKICPGRECYLSCSHASCKGYDLMGENRAISLEWLLRSICLMLLHIACTMRGLTLRCSPWTTRYKAFHHPYQQRVSITHTTLQQYEYIIKQRILPLSFSYDNKAVGCCTW